MKKFLLFLTFCSLATVVFSQQIQGTVQNQHCWNANDGSILVSVEGTFGITYSITCSGPNYSNSTNATSGQSINFTDLAPGAYTVVASSFGMQGPTQNFVIDPAIIPMVVDSIVNLSCFGGNDGSIGISLNNLEYNNFQVSWEAINHPDYLSSNSIISYLPKDSFRLTIAYNSESYNCHFDTIFSLTEPEEIIASEAFIQNATCAGANDGSLSIDIAGGTPPYTYLWSNGSTSDSIYNLSGQAGPETYQVTVTDGNGCLQYWERTIVQNLVPDIVINTQASSCGGGDGSAIVDNVDLLSGNDLYNAYSFLWSTGDTTYVINNLSAGTYSVNITDNNTTCVYTRYVTVNDSEPINLNPTIIEPSCESCNDGHITLNVEGGQSPYEFLWEGGNTTNTNNELFPGSYSVTATDANGCVKTECIGIANEQKLTATVSFTNATCGSNDGTATVTVSGGSENYAYVWNTSSIQTSATAINLTSGFYECVVTDNELNQSITVTLAVGDNGGTDSLSYEINESICGESSIDIIFEGSDGSESYLWSTGDTTQDLSGLNPGLYALLVTNGNCKLAKNISVHSQKPQVQPICMVSVDSLENEATHNLVIWERTQFENVDHYNIYRDNCAGSPSLLGSVDANQITVFEDIISIPSLKSYAYRITAVSPCGVESEMSPVHKTIHLELNTNPENNQIQLIWDDYVGFENPTFSIYKKEIDETAYSLLATVNNTQYSYVSTSQEDTAYYAIIVTKEDSCNAWNGNNKANGGPYYQSISNLEDDGKIHTSVNNIPELTGIKVYPNPTQSILNIQSESDILSIRIYNTSGQQVRHYQNINLNRVSINADFFNKGVYVFEIQTRNATTKKQVIIK